MNDNPTSARTEPWDNPAVRYLENRFDEEWRTAGQITRCADHTQFFVNNNRSQGLFISLKKIIEHGREWEVYAYHECNSWHIEKQERYPQGNLFILAQVYTCKHGMTNRVYSYLTGMEEPNDECTESREL